MLLRPATLNDIPSIVALERLPESTPIRRTVVRRPPPRHPGQPRRPLLCQRSRFRRNRPISRHTALLLRHPPRPGRDFRLHRAQASRRPSTRPGSGPANPRRTHPHGLRGTPRPHRFFLDVFDDNARARHVYHCLGFVDEGLMREAALRNGQFCSLRLMSLLDREFAAHKP